MTIQGKPATVAADNTYSGTADVTAGTTSVAIQATDPSGNVRTSTYDISASGPGVTFTYDANGNLTQKVDGGDTWVYEWTVENELKRVLKNAVEQASFKYDPRGRRVEKVAGGVTTTYTYDGKNMLRQVAGATTTLFVQGLGIDEPLAAEVSGSLSYYHADALGSIAKVTDQSVSTLHSYQYDAWGNILSGGTLAGPAFTGREWDPEIGLYYYRARYYDSKAGRFISEDPVRIPGRSLYPYVDNRPTGYIDPFGDEAISATIGGVVAGGTAPAWVVPAAVAITGAVAIKMAWDIGESIADQIFPLPPLPPTPANPDADTGTATATGSGEGTGAGTTTTTGSPGEVVPFPPPPQGRMAVCHRYQQTESFCNYSCRTAGGVQFSDQRPNSCSSPCPVWYWKTI